jgi:hypothetical protein
MRAAGDVRNIPSRAPVACPVPALPEGGLVRPADVLATLAYALHARGLTAFYGAADRRLGVLSVVYGKTVWTDGEMLWWRTGDQETRWPAADPDGAARLLLGEDS